MYWMDSHLNSRVVDPSLRSTSCLHFCRNFHQLTTRAEKPSSHVRAPASRAHNFKRQYRSNHTLDQSSILRAKRGRTTKITSKQVLTKPLQQLLKRRREWKRDGDNNERNTALHTPERAGDSSDDTKKRKRRRETGERERKNSKRRREERGESGVRSSYSALRRMTALTPPSLLSMRMVMRMAMRMYMAIHMTMFMCGNHGHVNSYDLNFKKFVFYFYFELILIHY